MECVINLVQFMSSVPSTLSFHPPCSPGEIINWVALDHEQQPHHQLIVLVTDHGVPRQNATVIAYISVTDINDNHPSFPQCPPGAELRVKVCSPLIYAILTCNVKKQVCVVYYYSEYLYAAFQHKCWYRRSIRNNIRK